MRDAQFLTTYSQSGLSLKAIPLDVASAVQQFRSQLNFLGMQDTTYMRCNSQKASFYIKELLCSPHGFGCSMLKNFV